MKQHIIYTVFAFVFLISCGKKDSNESESEIKTEQTEEHSDESPQTIASLTEEQMKAVDITLGKIEMKELTSTIKANGVLRVPNNNKATITSMYGGIIKTLNVQIGDFVRKGQVIASISNPEYIQLQEQYLTV
ncbi:MAG: biotin/lipoyl-binding protein, partial [Chryseobacterium sp.]